MKRSILSMLAALALFACATFVVDDAMVRLGLSIAGTLYVFCGLIVGAIEDLQKDHRRNDQ